MTTIAILAKAPRPGLAKTRLIPLLGEASAAALQERLLCRTVDTAIRAGLGPVVLWCAPDHRQPAFARCAERWPIDLQTQPDGDLGVRMLQAVERDAAAAGVLVIGTDCPALTPAHLDAAARQLRQGRDAVLIPAEDGGYVLIGLRRPDAGVFESVAWGSAAVAEQTRRRLSARGLRWSELPALWDVDRPDDLARLRSAVPGFETDAAAV